MTFWTNDSAKVKYAKEYFSSLNAMASKIIEEENKIAKSFSKGIDSVTTQICVISMHITLSRPIEN